MSRLEIKLRTWCETDDGDEMIYLGSGEFDNGLWFNSDKHISGYHSVMQFTGLIDKNKKEIYEGDILSNIKSAKGNYFVKFNVGGYDAVYKGNFTLCLHPVLHEFDGAEVIGNVYENPNLLY